MEPIGALRRDVVVKDMVGPWGLEPYTSTVSTRGQQVLTTTYKAVGDCQVLDNTPLSDTSRVGLRVEKGQSDRVALKAEPDRPEWTRAINLVRVNRWDCQSARKSPKTP